MKYEDALKAWGTKELEALKIERDYYRLPVNVANVTVVMSFNPGDNCCGGYDENCYCSMAEPARADVVISDGVYSVYISADDFDFGQVLGESSKLVEEVSVECGPASAGPTLLRRVMKKSQAVEELEKILASVTKEIKSPEFERMKFWRREAAFAERDAYRYALGMVKKIDSVD